MSEFIYGELVETTKNYIAKPEVLLKPGKKRFGIIIEPKIEMTMLEDTAEDFAALVQWADNSEEKVFYYEIEKVVK